MRWENGQVGLTCLKTREASVQECSGVESVQLNTLPQLELAAPKLTMTLTVARTTLPYSAFGFFVLHSWATPTVQLEASQMPFVAV